MLQAGRDSHTDWHKHRSANSLHRKHPQCRWNHLDDHAMIITLVVSLPPTHSLTQERMREELGYRTMMMSEEMEKWRQQAALTANTVLEAKNEVSMDLHQSNRSGYLLAAIVLCKRHALAARREIPEGYNMHTACACCQV